MPEQATHTPGPWKLCCCGACWQIKSEDPSVANEGFHVATVECFRHAREDTDCPEASPQHEVALANAELIARAPTLAAQIEALEAQAKVTRLALLHLPYVAYEAVLENFGNTEAERVASKVRLEAAKALKDAS